MAEITVGELLVRCLRAEGIDTTFGIIDGSHIPFVVAAAVHGIRHVNCHHEEGAVHIAEGYARISRQPSVVFGSPGPGAANMLAGLTSAQAEGHAVLAIGATRRRRTTDPDRGGAWQATDLVEMAKPIAKYSAMIRQAERLPEMVRAAFRAMLTGRPGPAFLAISDELLGQKIEESLAPVYQPANYRVTSLGAGDSASLARAAELLAAAKRPALHAGKGVLWADAAGEFLALAEHLGAIMTTSMGARGTVPEDHPNYFHLVDQQGSAAARSDADVVLVVGSRVGEYDGWGVPPAWGDPAAQTTIHIDSDPLSIGLNRPVDLPIVADAKAALSALLEAVKARTAPHGDTPNLSAYRERTAQTMAQGAEYITQEAHHGVHPAHMMMAVRGFSPRDAITVLDGGNTVLWGIAFHPIFAPQSFLYSVKMGYLGTGIPFAIGAKLAAPERTVVCVTGDGAAGFNVMEMETAARAGAQIIVLVAVDEGWGMERSAFGFGGHPIDKGLGIDLLPEIRYDEIAHGLGCYAERVSTFDEIGAAMERAVASGKPALIHVIVDPTVNANPPGYKEFRYVRTL